MYLIDQRYLPHEFKIEQIHTVDQMASAISEMHIRGAGAIGAAAGFGMYLCASNARHGDLDVELKRGAKLLLNSRPTAANLAYAVNRQLNVLRQSVEDRVEVALATANEIADEDAMFCRKIGEHGFRLVENAFHRTRKPVNILTHCNAGWLAFVDYGTATSPIYEAHDRNIPVHVWVDETRPRNQGSRLTAWELGQHGVPHTIIADNTGGHLMQHGLVDLVIVGTDRTTRSGFVANKIGTYLKALAAYDNNVPFYVALPSSTFDWTMRDGIKEIPIEQRGDDEVKFSTGLLNGKSESVLLGPLASPAANYAFDVTPPRLVSALITERGIAEASEESILDLFPEHREVR